MILLEETNKIQHSLLSSQIVADQVLKKFLRVIQSKGRAFWPTVIGNAIVIYSFCLPWIGARYFHGDKWGWKNGLIVSAASFAFMSLSCSSWQGRTVAYAAEQSIPMAMTTAHPLKQHRVDGHATLTPTLVGQDVAAFRAGA
ncbi:hypothetical protein [Mesorhizobium sp. 1B3]|uniref:hypothetical protein n=1 Tax=Mesorhizobium sp. 1B3 TaxID=3243599 RepID=UPI003D97AD07